MVQSTKKLRKQSMRKHRFTMQTNTYKQRQIRKHKKDQFLQSVDDNLTRRLCQKEDENSSEFLQDLEILDTWKWPEKRLGLSHP